MRPLGQVLVRRGVDAEKDFVTPFVPAKVERMAPLAWLIGITTETKAVIKVQQGESPARVAEALDQPGVRLWVRSADNGVEFPAVAAEVEAQLPGLDDRERRRVLEERL